MSLTSVLEVAIGALIALIIWDAFLKKTMGVA